MRKICWKIAQGPLSEMRTWWAVLTSLFLYRQPVDVPPIDTFQLPEKLYRYFPDPSRSVMDASLNEDVMEWQRYDIEFLTEPRKVGADVPK